MKPEIKTAWIAALRSGKYQQGRGTIFDGQAYCCLGVLGRLLADQGICELKSFANGAYHSLVFKDGASSSSIPAALREEIGLTQDDCDRAITRNDTVRQSFPEIADWIEKNL